MPKSAARVIIVIISVIMSILSCISIFSVGFSSWFSFEPTVNLHFSPYKSYGLLTIENVEMSVFQYSALSFKDEDYKDTSEGVVSIKYQIPRVSLETLDDEFTVSLTLGYNGISDSAHKLFYHAFETNKATNTCTVMVDGQNIDDCTLTEDDKIYFEKTFDNSNKNKEFLEFTVTYVFTIPYEDNSFRTTFGKYLVGSETDIDGAEVTKFTSAAEFILEN